MVKTTIFRETEIDAEEIASKRAYFAFQQKIDNK